ncbi:hypothetical protein QA601_07535 [Chitinispirillales bacterium ANBcel5]|uniref:hypothetical protein n=1 Tax=Cellulosispirillum alkaliphilum TaxID=3039283 RepID=UPI002A4F850D|nr:hypothetical protein [Chitinispirillales bacterium ANBcel5]
MMSKKVRFILFVVTVQASILFALEPEFFDSLEVRLRNDYRICTGNRSNPSTHYLIRWKREIDELLSSTDSDSLQKAYLRMTNRDPHDVRPCEIAVWYKEQLTQEQQLQVSLEEIVRSKELAEADSVSVTHELSSLQNRPADFFAMPAGITPQSFKWLFKRNTDRELTENNSSYVADSIYIQNRPFTATFYFDEHDRYFKYELVSPLAPADSLDLRVRQDAAILENHFKGKLELSPEVFRVGFFDIKEGKGATYRSWQNEAFSITIQLSTANNLYYTKAVVQYSLNMLNLKESQ